jgi:hypothetical protein
MGLKGFLNSPLVYQKFQEAGGFFGARVKSIECYLTLKDGQCVSAIGCGPGFIGNVVDIDVGRLVEFHKSHGRLATVTAVPSPGRFGILDIGQPSGVSRFHEKPDAEMGWINGGFFVLEPDVMDFIDSDDTIWEKDPLQARRASMENLVKLDSKLGDCQALVAERTRDG